MTTLPDFSPYGYELRKVLGSNATGGRITYLAQDLQRQELVVIKTFQFLQSHTAWSGYQFLEQEVRILQALDHPCIPRYRTTFETENSYCLVQEYKPAPSLAQGRNFSESEVKEIAIALLNILVYLQSQNPPIIHRDLKPANILVDRTAGFKVYLVDFGFARENRDEMNPSSVAKGTVGFIAPEQWLNRQLSEATDLYGLGATIICLLARIQDINPLIDEQLRINYKRQLKGKNPQLLNWLDKMVAPQPSQRYANAATALQALQAINREKQPQLPKRAFWMTGAISVLGLSSFLFLRSTPQQPLEPELPLRPTPQQPLKTELLLPDCPELVLEDYINELGRRSALTLPAVILNNEGQVQSYTDNPDNPPPLCPKLGQMPGEALQQKIETLAQTELQSPQLSNPYNTEEESVALNVQRLQQRKQCPSCFLKAAQLNQAQLPQVDLTKANLESASLNAADLNNATLTEANLVYANLNKSNLRGANLEGAYLNEANLNHADLRGANLANADLSGASLNNAQLQGANLKGAIMPNGQRMMR
jgi:serine/threonine protein kinase